MKMKLKNKRVIYFGGCGGIGEAICKLLIKKKVSDLAIIDKVENAEVIRELGALSPKTKVYFTKLDICNKEDVIKCIDALFCNIGQMDIMFNGCGICNEYNPELAVGVNLLGAMFCTMSFMENSQGQKGGMIVNIVSAGGLEPYATSPVYSATKAGIVSYSRSLAEEMNYRRHGISFICICPGITSSGSIDQFYTDNCSVTSEASMQNFYETRVQTCDEFAKNVMGIIQENKNGAVYMCRNGGISEISFDAIKHDSVFHYVETSTEIVESRNAYVETRNDTMKIPTIIVEDWSDIMENPNNIVENLNNIVIETPNFIVEAPDDIVESREDIFAICNFSLETIDEILESCD